MKKIKIYIFHPYSRIGGADLSISRLINNLNIESNSFSINIKINDRSINDRKINIKKLWNNFN